MSNRHTKLGTVSLQVVVRETYEMDASRRPRSSFVQSSEIEPCLPSAPPYHSGPPNDLLPISRHKSDRMIALSTSSLNE